jgi:hypothetical protein
MNLKILDINPFLLILIALGFYIFVKIFGDRFKQKPYLNALPIILGGLLYIFLVSTHKHTDSVVPFIRYALGFFILFFGVMALLTQIPSIKSRLPGKMVNAFAFKYEKKVQKKDTSDTDQKSLTPAFGILQAKMNNKLNTFGVILVIFVFGSLGTLLWANLQERKLGGIDHISALKDTVYIHMNRTLYHLDTTGKFLNKIALSSMGIKGRASDIQVLHDGTILIGDWDGRTVKRCDTTTMECSIVAPVGGKTLEVPFKFFADEANEQIYIIDTSNHQLLIQDMQGHSLRELAHSNILRFPNDIMVDHDGSIHIADTNHHRVVTLGLKGDAAKKIGTPINASDQFASSGHTWPVGLAKGSDGDWWVLNADGTMKDADLVIYDKSGQLKQKVTLPDRADPLDIAWAGETFLLTDFRLLRVYRIDPTTKNISDFGDSKFEAELENLSKGKKVYKQTVRIALNILFISIAGAFVLFAFFRKKTRTDDDKGTEPVPSSRGQAFESHTVHALRSINLDAGEKLALKNGMRIIWVIWSFMLLSLCIYVLVCHLLKTDLWGIVDIGDTLTTLKYVLLIVSFADFGLIHFMRKMILSSSPKRYPSVIGQYTTAIIVSLALAESIGIYGLVLFFLGSDYQTLYIFNVLAAIAMVIYRPKMEELEKLNIAIKRNQASS